METAVQQIVVGDKIRSYDFDPSHTIQKYFVEGKVMAIGPVNHYPEVYTILCFRDVRAGKDVMGRIGERVYVPVVVDDFMEFVGRVVKV